jgi:hypothetical protein
VFSEAAELVYHDKSTAADLRVQRHGKRARIRRAIAAWACCWGAAIAAAFVVVLHWVLVPLLVIAGPIMALSQLTNRVTVLEVEGPCPACGARVHETPKRDARTPIDLRCEGCRRALTVRLPPHLLER